MFGIFRSKRSIMEEEPMATPKAPWQGRQGDVFLERAAALPGGLRPVEREQGRIILAHGEVTGHAHAISDARAELFEDLRDGSRWLVIQAVPVEETHEGSAAVAAVATVPLQHEEHGQIDLDPGVYRVSRQREYTPSAPRWVLD